jgi:hypothetical protein
MREMRNGHSILVEKAEWKRPIGRPRRRWEDNIRMDVNGNRVVVCGLDSSCSGQGPLAGLLNTVMNFRVP